MTNLQRREILGTLTEEDEKRLNARLGVFYTLHCCGHIIKINHCFVARAFLAAFVLMCTFHVIYITTFLRPETLRTQQQQINQA